MSQPRKHHYLPQFYLRELSFDQRSLYRIEKRTSAVVCASIKDLAAIRDFHRINHHDTSDPFELEKKLAEIEGALSDALKRVLKDGIPDLQSHTRIVELVSLLRFRVPAIKFGIESSLRHVVRTTQLLLAGSGKMPPPPKGLEVALQFDRRNFEITNWICLKFMFKLAGDRDILRVLLSMRPTLVRAAAGSSFLTCDQPVAVYSPAAKRGDAYGVALVDSAVEISLPLSRSTLLLLTWRSSLNEVQADSATVAEYNRRTIVMADTYVFAAQVDDMVLRMVNAHRLHRAGIEAPEVVDLGESVLHKLVFRPVLPPEQYEPAV